MATRQQTATQPTTAADLFGRGVAPRGTREKLLHTALDLFYGYGFHAIGIDRIIDTVGVTKTTFYKHFESRDALILEVVRLRNEWESSAFEKCVKAKAGHDPRAMLLAMFDVLDDWFNDTQYGGCIFISACAEFPSQKHPVHRVAAEHFAASEEAIRSIAKAAGATDPAALARQWVLLLQGAVVLRLTVGDDGAARRARDLGEQLLASQLRPR
jgi:AcrR family transcriptional regulator